MVGFSSGRGLSIKPRNRIPRDERHGRRRQLRQEAHLPELLEGQPDLELQLLLRVTQVDSRLSPHLHLLSVCGRGLKQINVIRKHIAILVQHLSTS